MQSITNQRNKQPIKGITSMKIQQLYSYTRKAIDDYHMIEEGDKIAVGISDA